MATHKIETSAKNSRREKKYQKYEYDDLPKFRGSIRILKLFGNISSDAEVESELIEIAFSPNESLEHPYEALSWCWGDSPLDGHIIIRKGRNNERRLVKKVAINLVMALKALRYQRKDRYLWIDQVCINQENVLEKNHQVEIMSSIYGRARKVCIWLGEGDSSSSMALEFIKKQVLSLKDFDELCESEQASPKWKALLDLMQRPWFSRRWVVQEIALARGATVYCGNDRISWKKFAVAVELFVEVETATHRLSEVMKKDPRYYHVPGWFDHVSALGASLVVDATGKLFRDYKPNGPLERDDDVTESEADSEDGSGSDEGSVSVASSSDITTKSTEGTSAGLVRNSVGQPLLSLEYLVSSLAIFDVTKPHDAIYALLAIARDTTPKADNADGARQLFVQTQDTFERFQERKRYTVNYEQPFTDMCQEFVRFCMKQSKDRTRALDIICRPWAPEPPNRLDRKKRKKRRRGSDTNQNHDGVPSKVHIVASRATDKPVARDSNFRERDEDMAWFNVLREEIIEPKLTTRYQKYRKPEGHIPLPSWIQTLEGAPFAMYSQAGVHTMKMGRKNADTLVGYPATGQSYDRNYNAAETKKADFKNLRFAKRHNLKSWSLYVSGFELDQIEKILPASQGGSIPQSWAKAGGWENVPHSDPPDQFWRTLVADRGRDGKNPPVYYSRACKESFLKGGIKSGSVNTTNLIDNERCSVIAQFCRRVQAVIWNRCFITTKLDNIGLARQDVVKEDRICILYGCSVPVVLHRIEKTPEDVRRECASDLFVLKERILLAYLKHADGKRYRNTIKNLDKALNFVWENKMQERWQSDPNGRAKFLERYRKATIQPHKTRECSLLVTIEGQPGEFEISTSEGLGADEILEQQAYRQWEALQWEAEKQRCEEDRKMKMTPQRGLMRKGFQRQSKLQFALMVRYFRAWKRKVRLRKAFQASINGVQLPESINGHKSARQSQNSGAAPLGIAEMPNPESQHIRDKSDAYEERYRKQYFKQFLSDPNTTDLTPPDWTLKDKHSVAIQGKWCYWEFLGEAFVHGLMDGEAMAFQNRGEIPEQVFELR